MMLLILKFLLCSHHCQWSPPAETSLPKLWRGRWQVGWAPGYEWQGGLICQEALSRDSGWKVHWICLTKHLQLSVALQGAVTPSLTVSLAAMEGFSDGPCYCSVCLLPLSSPLNSSCCIANSPGGDSDPVEAILFATGTEKKATNLHHIPMFCGWSLACVTFIQSHGSVLNFRSDLGDPSQNLSKNMTQALE